MSRVIRKEVSMNCQTVKQILPVALAAAALGFPVSALADDDDDRLIKKLPDKVYQVLMERFPGANILQARLDDDDDDDNEYEVWLRHDGKLYEIELDDNKIDDVDREDNKRKIKDVYDDDQHKG